MSVTKKSTIMIVDDEPDILLILGEFLSGEGFRVFTAKEGAQAVEKLREKPSIDLVLLDIAMPKMDGIATLRELKMVNPGVAVMMITAYRDAEKVVEAFRLGAFDCLFKPFELKYLRNAITAKLLE
ncbi:MAG: response regulator [Endomicrobiales bacterium]